MELKRGLQSSWATCCRHGAVLLRHLVVCAIGLARSRHVAEAGMWQKQACGRSRHVAEAGRLASETEQTRACSSSVEMRLASAGLTTYCQSAAGAQRVGNRCATTSCALQPCNFAEADHSVLTCAAFSIDSSKAVCIVGPSEGCEECSKE